MAEPIQLHAYQFTEKQIKRFWSKIDIKESNECWEWTGKRCHGYGAFKHQGKLRIATRVCYALTHGKTELDRPYILHSCDNPPCCNPEHLSAGTAKINSDECSERGRRRIGSRAPGAKLTEESVACIKKEIFAGVKWIELANKFGVALGTIQNIAIDRAWRHVKVG